MDMCTKFLVVYFLANLCWQASFSEEQDQYYRSEIHPRLLRRPYRHAWPWPSFDSNLGARDTEPSRESDFLLRGVDAMVADTDAATIDMLFPPAEEESHVPHGRAVQHTIREDAVSFPKQDTSVLESLNSKNPKVWVPSVTKSCENDVLCEEVPNYPEHAIKNKLLAQLGHKTFVIGDAEPVQKINVRIRPVQATREETLCETTETIRYPRSARSATDNSWRFIINQANFTQGVKVETCKSPNQECKYAKHFPFGVKTACRQKYAARKLLAITENGETINDTFNLPSCCVCYVISDTNIVERNFRPQSPRQETVEGSSPSFS